MPKTITTKKFAANVILSIAANLISLIVSFVLTLIVPKFISEFQYAYWQMYVLYVGYVGVLHFGLLDGLILRYSKYDYAELDKKRILSQLKLLSIFLSIVSGIAILVALILIDGTSKLIIVLVAVGAITKNLVSYGSYMFQITNRISKYVTMSISQRITYGLTVVVLLLLKVNDYYWYCLADLFGDIIGLLIAIVFNKEVFFGKSLPIKESFQELKLNVTSGMILMLANWSSMLLIGGAKMIIQWRWGELLFGKVSFAISISNVFLLFVTAISVVLFPSLQRIEQEKLPQLYKNIRNLLSPILFAVMIFYFVGCWILGLWLPQYTESLKYLGVLLPIIIFSSKVGLLTNNYLKIYRKEKSMLLANFISIIIGISLFLLCAYVFDNIYALLCCVVFVIMLNSVISEIFVMKTIHIKIVKEFIIEGLMAVGFILCASLLDLWIGCAAYAGLLIVYCALNYKSIVALFKKIFKRKKSEVDAVEGD